MQIRKFLAPSLKEAVARMKLEMGEDAVVLSTKVLEGNLKLGQEKMFEITVALETDDKKNNSIPNIKIAKEPPKNGTNFSEELKKLTKSIFQQNPEPAKKVNREKPIKEKREFSDEIKIELEEISKVLLQREIEPYNVRKIIEQMNKYSETLDKKNIDQYLINTMSSMISTAPFELEKKKNRPKVIAMVGATGVGKTTCISKLAIISKILHKLDVGLITLDTYRLGALDQLKIFSEVSNIDFLAAYEPSDLREMMTKLSKKDIVFIDTVGRSQNNTDLLDEMKNFLSVVPIDEMYLVLSSTSTTKNLIDVANKFKVLNYNGIIFTKLDEAVSFGNIFNLLSVFNMPIKYLTNGQVIPDDIISADPEFIANMIYTSKVSK